MTATKVDGRAVIADEPAASPLRKGVTFTRIRRLLLDDGSTIHGCSECDYTAEKVGQVRAHLRKHAPRPTVAFRPRRIEEMNVGELIERARQNDAVADALDRMTDDRNEWKARALKAERAMANLRKALGVES